MINSVIAGLFLLHLELSYLLLMRQPLFFIQKSKRNIRCIYSLKLDFVGVLHLVFKTKRWDTDEIDKQRVLTAPEVLGIDEVHICDKMRLVLTDSEHGTLIDMHPRKTIPTVKKAIHALEGYENIKIVTMDMDTGYRNAVKELIPSAMVVIDRFHVVSHISTATQSAKKQIVENLI